MQMSTMFAAAIFVFGIGAVVTIKSIETAQDIIVETSVAAHAELLDGMLKNNAEIMCPMYPGDSAEAVEMRAAWRCEAFGL